MNASLKRGWPVSDESILYTNSTGSAIAKGALVALPGGWGVAAVNIANGASGTVWISGEYTCTKGTGYTLAQDDLATWDGTKVVAWTTASTTRRGLVVTEAAGSSDTTVSVRLAPVNERREFKSVFTVTSTEAALNSNNGRVDFVTGFGVAPTSVSVMVLTVTSGVVKSGFAVSLLSGGSAGTVRVDGVAASTQLDAGDVVHIQAWL